MDIDVIVASGGNVPDTDMAMPVGLGMPESGYSGFSAGSSIGSSSFLGSNLNASDEATMSYSGHASPSSLPSNFGHHAHTQHVPHGSYQQPSYGAHTEKSRSPKRTKSKTVSVSGPGGSQMGGNSMESMMFGWKLSRKVIPPEIQAFTDQVRKRNMIDETNNNNNKNAVYNSPLASPHMGHSAEEPRVRSRTSSGRHLPHHVAPIIPAHPYLAMSPQRTSAPGSPITDSPLMDTTNNFYYAGASSLPGVPPLDLGRTGYSGRITPDVQHMSYDNSPHLPGGILPPYHELLQHGGNSPKHSFVAVPSPVASTTSSPRTPTFGLAGSPLSSSVLTSGSLAGLPGSNGTSAFQVVGPRNSLSSSNGSISTPSSLPSTPIDTISENTRDRMSLANSPPASPATLKRRKK